MHVGVEADVTGAVRGHGQLHIVGGIASTACKPAPADSPLADDLLTSNTTVLAVDEELCVLRAFPGAAALLSKRSLLTIEDGILQHAHVRVQARLAITVYDALTSGRPTILVLPGGWSHAFHMGITPEGASDGASAARQARLRVERRQICDRPDVLALRTVFGISRAESRVLPELVAGYSANECANVLSLSVRTIRKHLASILEKTGCAHQADLIRLARAVASPHPSPLVTVTRA
jgi:DNA-binding CsgD family transcriptional regulator